MGALEQAVYKATEYADGVDLDALLEVARRAEAAEAEVIRLRDGLRTIKATGFDSAHDPHGDLAREAGRILDALLVGQAPVRR